MFVKLQFLTNSYIQGLKEILLHGKRSDLQELIIIIKSLFQLHDEYIGEFWKKLKPIGKIWDQKMYEVAWKNLDLQQLDS